MKLPPSPWHHKLGARSRLKRSSARKYSKPHSASVTPAVTALCSLCWLTDPDRGNKAVALALNKERQIHQALTIDWGRHHRRTRDGPRDLDC